MACDDSREGNRNLGKSANSANLRVGKGDPARKQLPRFESNHLLAPSGFVVPFAFRMCSTEFGLLPCRRARLESVVSDP